MVYRICECGESDQSQFRIRKKKQKNGAIKEYVEKKCNACLRIENRERSRRNNEKYLQPELTEIEKLFNLVLQSNFNNLRLGK